MLIHLTPRRWPCVHSHEFSSTWPQALKRRSGEPAPLVRTGGALQSVVYYSQDLVCCAAMSGLHDRPKLDTPQWEPEPLYLPLDETPVGEHSRGGNRKPPRNDRDDDLPGSHVIVIDLA